MSPRGSQLPMPSSSAYVLAGELGRAAGDHAAAFARYEEIMRPYVATAHTLAPGGVDGFLPRGRFTLRMRVFTARLMHHWPMRQIVARMLDKSEAIELPDYASTSVTVA